MGVGVVGIRLWVDGLVKVCGKLFGECVGVFVYLVVVWERVGYFLVWLCKIVWCYVSY